MAVVAWGCFSERAGAESTLLPPTYYAAQSANTGTGNQAYGGSGFDFNVNAGQTVYVYELGVYDSGADGINGAGTTLTAVLWNRSGTPTALASLSFTQGSPGTYDPTTGYLFKPLSTALVLSPGQYSLLGYGWAGADTEHNAALAAPATTFNTGGGLITWVQDRYGGGSDLPSVFGGTVYAGHAFDSANMRFGDLPPPVPLTPEPGSILMFAVVLPVAGWLLLRRRRLAA